MSVRWIENDAALQGVIDALLDEPRYALDTEFVGERTYLPRIALVQVAWRGGVALIDPLRVSLEPFAQVLSGEGLAIVHAADQDLDLVERACGVRPSRLFDPQLAAAFVGFSQPSLGALARDLLGVQLEKSSQLADWLHRPLSESELRYAAADVEHLLAIHDVLVERLVERGHGRWVEDELEELRMRSRVRPDPQTLWWRLKGANKLSGRARGVAQALTAWREREAERRDVPVARVLSDLAIVALSSRPPRTERQLHGMRGLDSRRMGAAEQASLLRLVAEGLDLGKDRLCLPPSSPAARRSTVHAPIFMAIIGQIAQNKQIDRAVLATRADVDNFLAGSPSRLREGMRYELVGQLLEGVVAGRITLRLLDDDRLELCEVVSSP